MVKYPWGSILLKRKKPRGSVHIPPPLDRVDLPWRVSISLGVCQSPSGSCRSPLDGSINPPVRGDTPLERAISPLPKNIEDKTTRSFKIFEGFQGTFYKKFPEWGLGQRPK